MKEAADRRD